jgi:hypothetical protein
MNSGLCECGCGKEVRSNNRFVHGHHRRGFRSTKVRWLVEDRGFTTPCWIWQDYKTREGYGVVSDGRHHKTVAHRLVYRQQIGEIPSGLTLDHLCRQRACVNPGHMEPVTFRENVLRGSSAAARNARKTHCVKGHPFTPKNTRIRKDGARLCITCRREIQSRRKEAVGV